MRSAGWLIAMAFVGLGVAATAAAQPHRGGGTATPPAERGDAAEPTGNAERREQIKKKIRAMRAYLLTEELSLDEQTAAKLFPVLSRYDDQTDKLLERRIDIQRRLRRANPLKDAKDAKAVDRVVDEALANQREFWELEDRRVTELRKILMPGQTARLLVVLPELERKIRNQLRKAIVSRRGAGAMDDEDDDQQPDEVGPRSAPPPKLRRREAPLAPRSYGSDAPGNTPR